MNDEFEKWRKVQPWHLQPALENDAAREIFTAGLQLGEKRGMSTLAERDARIAELEQECAILRANLNISEAKLKAAEKALIAIKNAPGGGPGRRIASQALGDEDGQDG